MKPASPRLVFAALLAVQFLYGFHYVASKMILAAYPPLVWASFRCLSAGLLMLAAALIRRVPCPRGRAFFLPLIGFSVLAIVLNQGAFTVGLYFTTSANAAVLNTLIPIFTLGFVILRGQEKLKPKKAAAFLLSLIGVAVLMRVEQVSFSDQSFWGDALMIVNSVSYALYLVYAKKFLETYDRLWTTTWLFLYGSVGMAILALPSWISMTPPPLTPAMTGYLLYAVVGGTFLTYLFTNWALAHTEASRVALFIYIQPAVTTVVAWFWLEEAMSVRAAVGDAFIFLGVFLAIPKTFVPGSSPQKRDNSRLLARFR